MFLECLAQSILASVQLGTLLTEVSSTSSTKQQALVLVTPTCTLPFLSIPFVSTIISILSILIISAKIVEPKYQPRTTFLMGGKGKEEEIDLDEEIVIPNWDISNITPD